MKMLTRKNLQSLPPLGSQEGNPDPIAQVKFFTPDSGWTWYATEFNPEEGRFYGWIDNGREEGEFGYFTLSELETARGPLGMKIERDTRFHPISLSMARKRGL